jgi:sugar O-acyltransferase (sialic acid O-acetyltransferase NeuD family)
VTTLNRIGIFGTSGMAREAGDIAWVLGLEPIYVARNQAEVDAWGFPAPVILEQDVRHYTDMPYVIGIGEGSIRKAVAERFKDQLRFTNLIHPSATFGSAQREAIESCTGAIIAAGARLTNGISVGDFCIFNQNVTVAHDCRVGDYVHVAPGANVSGNVYLQDGCWVGAGAVINQGSLTKKLEVGSNTVVGAGAVVIDDCDPDAVYVGVPAKRIK